MDNVQIKLRLEQMRKGVLSRQAKLSRHVERRKEPLPADFAEQAVELENEETIVQLARQMNEELVKLDAALVRLGEDRYTTCVPVFWGDRTRQVSRFANYSIVPGVRKTGLKIDADR